MIYLDTDSIFLAPVEQVWEIFNSFNAYQVAGMAEGLTADCIGWYEMEGKGLGIPFLRPHGQCV